MFRFFAQTYMAMRECMAPTPRLEAQTEVLADLHACIDNLKARRIELDARSERCRMEAVLHMKLVRSAPTAADRARENTLARMALEERRRVQAQREKAQRMYHMLQMQVDGIATTHMDNLIVDTMRAYNVNAARMAMPARARQVSKLGDELSDRQTELYALQEAIASVTLVGGEEGGDDSSEAQLMQELEALMELGSSGDEAASTTKTIVQVEEPNNNMSGEKKKVKKPPLTITLSTHNNNTMMMAAEEQEEEQDNAAKQTRVVRSIEENKAEEQAAEEEKVAVAIAEPAAAPRC